MHDQITLSARDLGAVSMSGFCPRCFWIQLRMGRKLPFQTLFPGIFSSIDVYTKRVVHGWFDDHGAPPPWLEPLGDVVAYVNPPHYTKFSTVDAETNIRIRGTADGILKMADASYIIVDYKTARHTDAQDELHPLYETQLNVYARIGNSGALDAPVRALALVYMEPVTDGASAVAHSSRRDDGFAMGFTADIVPVRLAPDMLPPLLARTREIYELRQVPSRTPGCKDCAYVDSLVSLTRGKPTIDDYVRAGESETVEFKGSMRWDYRQGRINKALEKAIARSVAAFMNSKGGTLIVGVSDDGDALGLEQDFATLHKHPNQDGWEQHLRSNVLSVYLPPEIAALVDVSFEDYIEKTVAVIRAERRPEPVFVKDGEFHIRAGNTTQQFDPQQTIAYVQQRFPRESKAGPI